MLVGCRLLEVPAEVGVEKSGFIARFCCRLPRHGRCIPLLSFPRPMAIVDSIAFGHILMGVIFTRLNRCLNVVTNQAVRFITSLRAFVYRIMRRRNICYRS